MAARRKRTLDAVAAEMRGLLSDKTVVSAASMSAPEHIFALCHDMTTEQQECLVLLTLDARIALIRRVLVAKGGLASCPAHPRDVFREALKDNAHSVVLVHCHPSGDPEPSGDDLALTRRMTKAGVLIGIPLVDHIIVGRNGYVSLSARGVL